MRDYNSQKTMPQKKKHKKPTKNKTRGEEKGKREGSRENGIEAAARSGWSRVERVKRKRRRCCPTIPGGRAVGGLYPGCEVLRASADLAASVSLTREEAMRRGGKWQSCRCY